MKDKMTAAEYREFVKPPAKKQKYGNKVVVVDDIRFMSQREANRYGILKLLAKENKISNLKLQVPFELKIEATVIETYIADFTYRDNTLQVDVVEDSKGMRTPTYKRKRKWMLKIFGIKIKET